MNIKKVLCVALMGSMVFSMSVLAAPGEDSTVSIVCQDEKDCIEHLESIKLNTWNR